MAYILFVAAIVFVVWEIFMYVLTCFVGEEPPKMITNWIPLILFIGAAVAKYIAS